MVSAIEWWLLVWVLLDTTTLNLCSADCTGPSAANGTIRVSSTNALTAGYILICDEMEWRAVCHNKWDKKDAMVVCRQLGFDPQAIQRTIPCTANCFGRTERFKGLNDVKCIGNEARLIDCPARRTDNINCNYAGVTCGTMTPNCPTCPPTTVCPSCPQTTPPSCLQTTPPACTCLQTNKTPTDDNLTLPTTSPLPLTETPPSCTPSQAAQVTVIGGALGALAAGLGLALVGVVMGWVWHCQRNKGKCYLQEKDAAPETLSNPTYCSSAPSTQYSSQGPGDTLLNTPTTVNETSFATYDVVRADYQEVGEVGRGEGEYHVLGEERDGAYEVLIPTATQKQAKKQADTHYSSLQHH